MKGALFMIKHKRDLVQRTLTNLQGGKGDITREDLFSAKEMSGKFNVCTMLTLPSGVSIGEHKHGLDAEIYFVVSGSLRVTENGNVTEVSAGDTVFTTGGNSHRVENVSNADACLLVIIVP